MFFKRVFRHLEKYYALVAKDLNYYIIKQQKQSTHGRIVRGRDRVPRKPCQLIRMHSGILGDAPKAKAEEPKCEKGHRFRYMDAMSEVGSIKPRTAQK